MTAIEHFLYDTLVITATVFFVAWGIERVLAIRINILKRRHAELLRRKEDRDV